MRAPAGHALTHAQHLVHFILSVTISPPALSVMACVGQTSTHFPHRRHRLVLCGADGDDELEARYGTFPLMKKRDCARLAESVAFNFFRQSAPQFLALSKSSASGRPAAMGIFSRLKLCSPTKAPAANVSKPSFSVSSRSSTKASS